MNLFELFVKIGVDDQATKGIKEVEKTADKASKGGLANFASKLGGGLKTAAKIGTVALGMAATGITALTTAAIKSYAEYEQLVGGAELMFGEAFDYVKARSEDAYKTVQMSQNEYLQQVNGFAAGLKTALGGNEQAAAELADRIITAEADIIAATGNTAENVQNAFNGIMKSNFTMLDNLQIGITPTKEGFQEVIDKVNEWNTANGEATSYQMGNLADMQSALVDYIEMVGMSGYAQREASQTIQGSLASVKSAWSNLLTGITDENADFEKLVGNLVDTLVGTFDKSTGKIQGGFINNLFPRIEVALGGIADVIEKLAPIIVEKLPSLLDEILPSLLETATKSISAIRDIIPSLLQTLLNAVIDNLPLVIETGMTISDTLIKSISENKDKIISGALNIVTTLINGTLKMLPDILKLGLDLIISLANGITKAIQEDNFIQTIIDVVGQIVKTLTNPITLANLINSALDLILALVEGLLSDESLTALTDAIFMLINNLISFLLDEENISKIVDTGVTFALTFWSGIWNARWKLFQGIVELALSLMGKIENMDWRTIGQNIINSLWNGIQEVWNNLVYWFTNELSWFSDVGDTISGIFGNSSSFGGGANARINGSHAGGLSYVPFDGYIAQLHKGERVLTASEAQRYNNGQYYGGTTDVNVTVGFDNDDNGMGLARWLYPKIKQVEKEVYA